MKIHTATKLLTANEKIAQTNKAIFDERKIFVVNLISSPGSGKTSTLEKTIALLKNDIPIAVIEGDIAGNDDANRIEKLSVPVVQINTAGACHLDANMIYAALSDLTLDHIRLLFIENVGNLVCPAEFKLGEDIKVVILSITEGHDKPLKYPLIFQEASVLLINKIDLKDVLNVNIEKIKKDALSLNPGLKIFEISALTGLGFDAWTEFLKNNCQAK